VSKVTSQALQNSREWTPNVVCLQAATENWQRWCRHDMRWRNVPDMSSADWQSSVANSWQLCMADRQWWHQLWSQAGSNSKASKLKLWIGLSSVLRPCQHSIGHMGDGFYRSKDPTNSIKVLKEIYKGKQPREQRKHKIHICILAQNSIQIHHTSITQQVP